MHGCVEVRIEPIAAAENRSGYPELERLMSNAVCDERFAQALLADPARALSHAGYNGRLSATERALVTSVVGAGSLAEFAAQLVQQIARPSSPRI